MSTPIDRRTFLAAAAAAAALGSTTTRGQAWPARAVRVLCAFPAGGLTDALARAYSEQLAARLGQPFVVENRPGASGMIAGADVAKAAPDGHTFLFTISTALNQNRVLYRKMPYDPDRDFTYVSGFHAGHLPLAVHAALPIRSARDFIELAKRDIVTLGNYSAGSYPHMVAQQLNKLYGTKVEPVHYKGEAPMWADVASGQITAGIGSIAAMLPHLQSGRVRPVAVPTLTRSPRLPEVPTFAEQGYREPVFLIEGWIGMFGPAGLPRAVVERISQLNQEAADTPRIRQIHENFGLLPKPWAADAFEKLNREIGPVWVSLARELGVTLE